jgi:hypothetical protein
MTSGRRPYLRWILALLIFLSAAIVAAALFSPEVWARVGGGGSYGGGSRGGGSSGGGGGGGGAALVRFLIYLTVEYPAIGIPLDILIIGGLIYRWTRPRRKKTEVYSSAAVKRNKGSASSSINFDGSIPTFPKSSLRISATRCTDERITRGVRAPRRSNCWRLT